jgi:hypothetical protein
MKHKKPFILHVNMHQISVLNTFVLESVAVEKLNSPGKKPNARDIIDSGVS